MPDLHFLRLRRQFKQPWRPRFLFSEPSGGGAAESVVGAGVAWLLEFVSREVEGVSWSWVAGGDMTSRGSSS